MIKVSAIKFIWLLFIGFTFYLIMACQPKEEVTPSPEFLFGKWVEKESEEVTQFGGTNHVFEFTKEAFFLERNFWTDAIDPNNECLNPVHRLETRRASCRSRLVRHEHCGSHQAVFHIPNYANVLHLQA